MVFFLNLLVVLGIIAAVSAVWGIASLRSLLPTEVGLIRYFGHVEKRLNVVPREPRHSNNGLFGTGLHFVPLFWGIKLIRISNEMTPHPSEGDPNKPSWEISGNQLPVRSKNRQKLGIDLTFFLRFPYKDVDLLILLISNGVPFEDVEALSSWIRRGFAPDVGTTFGRYRYQQVMGALKNDDLSREVNELLQKPNSLFAKSGFFDQDPTTMNVDGFGEAYLRIEYVHVSGKLGQSLELVATSKQEAIAAKSIAQNKAEVIGAPIEIMLDRWVAKELKNSGVDMDDATAVAAMKKSIMGSKDYVEAETAFRKLRSQEMAGGGTYTKAEFDINSAGQPVDPNLAGIVGGVAAVAAAVTGNKAQPPQGIGGPGGGGKKNKDDEFTLKP